ncbi:hypothetical protein [Nostoc punctiforme]|uniref:hypothetical protein n=1 Tax=Nostoc punctiforme TaxID=272131 RepID=UPI001427D1BF
MSSQKRLLRLGQLSAILYLPVLPRSYLLTYRNNYQEHFYDKPRATHLKCVGTGKEEDNQQAGDRKEEAQRLCGGSEFPPALMVFFP